MSSYATKTKQGISGFLRRLFANGEASEGGDRHVVSNDANSVPSVGSHDTYESYYSTSNAPQGDVGGKYVQLPLRAIIAALPLELRGKVKKTAIGDVTIPVLQSKILGQLTSGAVRIGFGEIRAAAPAVFLGGGDADKVFVTLPLAEILPRLNPALLARRPMQRHVEVAREISSPFDDPAQALVFSVGDERAANPVMSPTPSPVAASPSIGIGFRPISRTPAAVALPAASLSPAAEIFTPPPVTAPKPAAPIAKPAAPIVVRMTHPPKSQAGVASILVPLSSLAEHWPEILREEIVQQGLAEVRVGLPTELMEISLKRGRVVFQWKVIRTWMRPVQHSYTSVHDAMEVELPLKVVAPMFLQKRTPGDRVQQRLDIDESIPNLFFGFPKPDAVAAAPVTDTNYYVWSDTNESVQVEESVFKKRAGNGTEFVAKYATPNEIVSRAAAQDGVAGAVIALPDGLMVASQIPPEQNAETLAAFLPQIFARVSQSTKELRMGDLNNLSFTVGNVPWKIFRVNAIFFAVFGREGESMPTAQLAGLAAELDRKQK